MSTKRQALDEENTMPEEAIKSSEETASEPALFSFPVPCVYCGPSIRGVARQFTPYTAGVPEELKEFVAQHPAAKGLIVPLERFAQTRRDLETKGTAAYLLYQKVRSEALNG